MIEDNSVLQEVQVSILIVCYNSRNDIDRCLKSVLRYTVGLNYEILLLDNSHDGTAEHVSHHYSKVKIVENSENLGFAGGNNKLALRASGEKILLLNPDTELTGNAVKELYDFSLTYRRYAAWGGITLFPNGRREYSSLQVRPTLRNEFLKVIGLADRVTESTSIASCVNETHVLSGAFMLIDSDLWKSVGGFDETYFLYSEEVDLCMRLERFKGAPLLINDSISIIHYVGKSTTNADRTVYMFKGRMHLERKMYGRMHNILMLGILFLWAFSRYSYGFVLNTFGKRSGGRDLMGRFSKVLGNPRSWTSGYK